MFFFVSLVLGMKFLSDRNYKNSGIFITILFLAIIVGLKAENLRDLILISLFLLEARNMEFKRFARFYCIISSIFLFFVLACDAIGVFDSITVNVVRSTNNTVRHLLGFNFTTYSANFFLSIVLAYLYIDNRKKRLLSNIILLLLNYFFFFFTDTKVAFFETLLFIVGVEIIKLTKFKIEKHVVVAFFSRFIFVFSAAVSLFVAFSYQTNFFIRGIDKIFNYRISLAYRALAEYPIMLFGNKVEWVLKSGEYAYFYVDCSYIQVLLQYGLVIFALIILGFTSLIKKEIAESENITVWCLIIVALHSITDPQLLNLAYNPFLLMLPLIFVRRDDRKNKRIFHIETLKA